MNRIGRTPYGRGFRFVAVLTLCIAAGLPANVGDPARWKPNFEQAFKAPPPADADARAKAFAERNSKANLEKLAKEFFTLVDLSKVPEALRVALDKGDHEAALNAYRDFFMERLATFSADEKQNPGIRPRQPPFPFEKAYLHTADDLLNNTTVFGMIDTPLPPEAKGQQDYYDICNRNENQKKKGNVRIEFGPPGRANWTWQPEQFVPLGFPHLPFDKAFMSAACGRPHFFTPLLVKYIETKDAKYWDKWLAFMDDICINWRRDTMRAGLNPSHNLNNIEFFTDGTWANLAYLMQKSPDMVKAVPAPTLVRMLNRMWMEYMSDALQYGRNLSTARRIMFDNFHNLRIAVSFPEFKGSEYCVREMVRAVESLPYTSIMPDGCDVHDSRNYNKGTPEYVLKVYTMLQNSKQAPPWVNDQWLKDQFEWMRLHTNFIFRELWVTGGYPHWNLMNAERGVFADKNPWLKQFVPEAFADQDNAKIISNIFGDGTAGAPSFTSDAYPYGGYYCVRTGWTKQDQWLYMASTRPVSSITHPDNNNFSLYAYGRHLLANTGTWTPVAVDGCNQIENSKYMTYPETYRKDVFRPLYGRAGSANAYRTPLKRRWHSSEFFDVLEGEYTGPFARAVPNVFIDDVSHQRQILFVRKLGLWIVTDRMKSPTQHTYEWAWPFYCPSPDEAKRFPGFKREQIVTDAKEQTIKTNNPNGPNLSLYSFALEPMEKAGSGFKVNKKSDWMVVTALYTRKFDNGEVAPDLSNVKALKGANGECGFAATIPGGGSVIFQAAPSSDTMTLLVCLEDGSKRSVAFGCKGMEVGGAKRTVPPDYTFTVKGPFEKCEPIYRPLDLPVIGPAEDRFSDELKVTLTHTEPGVEIRYTLDGADPVCESPLYNQPIPIQKTTVVKARAFRKGVAQVPQTSDSTKVSAVVRAVFTKEAPWEAVHGQDARATKPGLAFTYYEDDGTWPISAFNLDAMKAVGSGTCAELFDVSATKMKDGGFAFSYTGYLDIPKDGVYSIHAPPEFITPSVHAGYDLRVYLDGKEWYPTTRVHNFGTWSVPLKPGKHALRVVYINQQNVHLMADFEDWKDYYWSGTKPGLLISGPGLEKQPIPAAMLCR
ncbi:MAG: chitobiase/beta-hexosaminidase C-terminal domain-containing protein [Planctomycetota bacterium]|nr:chitobiase/beta-hexosaminidase C-terminal domain-containing protein [Planctomycetota bacterium]